MEQQIWKLMFRELTLIDWHTLDSLNVNDAVLWFNTRIFTIMSIAIPKKYHTARRSSHPWMNEHCLNLLRARNAAEGTELYQEACKQCSEGMYEQFLLHVQKVHLKLKKLPAGSKKWWRLSHKVLQKPDSQVKSNAPRTSWRIGT